VPLRDGLGFTAEYRRLLPVARHAAFGVLRDHAAAEDVAQEVFVTLWERPRLFDPARGSLAGLVRVMARSRALDQRRRQAAAQAAGEGLHAQLRAVDDSGDLQVTVARRARTRALLDAIDELAPEQRQAVLATQVAGYTAAEMSAATEVPLGTMKSRVRAGLRRLESVAA
jgi:RNA polymerase sigma-70 factor (ECF subfamily)